MEQKQVFISYKSEEINEALWVKDNLEAQGITCWMAPMNVTGGASFATEIAEAIDHCSIFVLLLSAKAQQSPIITKELHRAVSKKKVIMPFLLENCPLKGDFEFLLCDIHYYNGYKDKAAAMKKMLREIRPKLRNTETPARESFRSQAGQHPQDRASATHKQHTVKHRHPFSSVHSPFSVLAKIPKTIIYGITQKVVFATEILDRNTSSITLSKRIITAEDMQKLSKFRKLTKVILKNCVIQTEDLSGFSNHPLRELVLSDCSLTDSQLRSIPFDQMKLKLLNLDNNTELTDLSIIAPIANTLINLSLSNTGIKNLDALSVFTNLSTLDLSNNKALTELSAIAPLADTLTTLSISNTGINNLQALYRFTKITELSVENLGLFTLAPLQMMVYLNTLIANGNHLMDLTGLENTTILKKVSLKNNQLINVDYLANSATTLQEAYLDGNALTNLDNLSGCTKMISFSAKHNQLTSMDWAYSWTNLKYLSVANNQIQFITLPPAGKHLNFLDLSSNQLSWFNNFTFSAYSITVNLSNNRLTSVILPKSSHYSHILLHGNPLDDLDFFKGFRISTLSIDYFYGLNAKTVEDLGDPWMYIIDCPPKHIVELEQASYRVKLLSRKQIPTLLPDPEFPDLPKWRFSLDTIDF